MHTSTIQSDRNEFEKSVNSPTLSRTRKQLIHAHASFLQWSSSLIASKQAKWTHTPHLGSIFDASPNVSRCFGFDDETGYIVLTEGLEWFGYIEWKECLYTSSSLFFTAIIAGESFAIKIDISQAICQDLTNLQTLTMVHKSAPKEIVSQIPLISNMEWSHSKNLNLGETR